MCYKIQYKKTSRKQAPVNNANLWLPFCAFCFLEPSTFIIFQERWWYHEQRRISSAFYPYETRIISLGTPTLNNAKTSDVSRYSTNDRVSLKRSTHLSHPTLNDIHTRLYWLKGIKQNVFPADRFVREMDMFLFLLRQTCHMVLEMVLGIYYFLVNSDRKSVV